MEVGSIDSASELLLELLESESIDRSDERLEKLEQVFKTACDDFINCRVDGSIFLSLVEKIQQLDESGSPQTKAFIKKLWNQTLGETCESRSLAPPLNTFHLLIGRPFARLTEAPFDLLSRLYPLIFPMNPSWKQKKYHYTLANIVEELQKRNINLQELIHTIEKTNKNDTLSLSSHAIATLLLREENISERARYYELIHLIRETLRDPLSLESLRVENSAAAHFLRSLFLIRYLSIDIYPFAKEVLKEVGESGLSGRNQSFFSATMREQRKAIDASPSCLKGSYLSIFLERLRGALNVAFDPINNIPSRIYALCLQNPSRGHQTVDVFRTSCPTRQRTTLDTLTYQGDALVNEEFLGFISAMKAEGKKLLFLSLQDEETRIAGDETERNKALKRLSENEPETFLFSILPHDNPFYNQTETKELVQKDVFIKTFLDLLFTNEEDNSALLAPPLRKNRSFYDLTQNLLSNLMSALFKNKSYLSFEERQNFIEITYAFLVLSMVKELQPNALCIACKHSIDRTMKLHAVLLKILHIFIHEEGSPKRQEELSVIALSPALLFSKRGMNERAERMFAALELLSNQGVAERLRAEFATYAKTISLVLKEE